MHSASSTALSKRPEICSAVSEDKNRRLAGIQQISPEEADEERKETDRFRRAYHNFYSKTKWGDSRAYDLIINSSRLGITGTADYIKAFAEAFREKE